jgi:hypothetical protein
MTDRLEQFHALYGKLRIADQKQFYAERRDEYRTAHRQAIIVRNGLLVAAAMAGVGGQLTEGTARALVSIGAAVFAALAGLVTAFEALIGFPRLGKLYEDAWINLSVAEVEWGRLDPHGDISAGLGRVEQIFRKENGQWGQLVVRAEPEPGEDGAEDVVPRELP